MSDYEMIYGLIDSLIPDKYTTTWNDMNDYSENACGIYIRSGNSSPIRELDGSIVIDNCNIVLNIHGLKNNNTLEILNDFFDVKNKILSLINMEYTDYNSMNKLVIYDTNIIGNINPIGKNNLGIPIYSINFSMRYMYIKDELNIWIDTNYWNDDDIWYD